MAEKSALVIIDVQNDFLPGGSLGIPGGDVVVPVLNEYLRRFEAAGLPIFLTRDWHPQVTHHFKQYGGVWPAHCIQGTRGAEFPPDLYVPKTAIIVSKGMDPNQDAYSACQAYTAEGVLLEDALRQRGVTHLYIGGLATDYCVRWSALDVLKKGFKVTVLLDGIRGVNLQLHDLEEAIEEMVRAGAEMTTLNRIKYLVRRRKRSRQS